MKWHVCLTAAMLMMFVTAVLVSAQETEKKEEPKKEEQKEADDGLPPPPERPKGLEEAVKKADLIFVGSVDYMGERPGSWGRPPYRPSSQYVRYVVERFLKSRYETQKITVIHEILQGAKLVSQPPGLNPTIFDTDKRVIVLLSGDPIRREPVTFVSNDPDFGAMAWSEEEEKNLKAMIGK
jgi:hypothetical protein